MTADNKFAARLRALSKDASPGPWEIGGEVGPLSWSTYNMTSTDGGSSITIDDVHGGDYVSQNIQANGRDVYIAPSRVTSGEENPTAPIGNANARLVVALRNHADRLADLVERVEALRHYDDPTVLLKASELAPLLAALDALGGAE